MAIMTLGRRPELLRVQLIPGSGFFSELELVLPEDTFEVGGPPILVYPGTEIEWPAEVLDSKHASFEVTAEDVDALIATSPSRAAMLTVDDDKVWAAGKFEVEGKL